MRQKHSWTALVALLIILIDSHAQQHFSNKNSPRIVSNKYNNNNNSSRAFAYNEFNEIHENKVEDVNKRNAVNITLNELNSISRKSNRIEDKKLVVAGVNGSVFSYPLSLHKRTIVDGRYWPMANNLSHSTLPLMRAHTGMKFSQLPREIARKQQSIHVTTDVAIHSTNQRLKDDIHMRKQINMKNTSVDEINVKYWLLTNEKNRDNITTEKLLNKYKVSSDKTFTSNYFVKLKTNKKQSQISEIKKITNSLNDKIAWTHRQSSTFNNRTKSTELKTTDTTPKVPLKVLAKFSPLPPYVKPKESLFNEEFRVKNQAIKPKQPTSLSLNGEFSKISVIIETFSSTTKSNNEKYQHTTNPKKIIAKNFVHNNKKRYITSVSNTSKQKREIIKQKESATRKLASTLDPNKINDKSLFSSERKIFPHKATSTIVRSNKSINSIASEVTTSKDYHDSSHINSQLGHSNQLFLPTKSYNISLASAISNPTRHHLQEPAQTSIMKSNRRLQSDMNISQPVKLYSKGYILHEADTRNIIPLKTTVTTTVNIENLTNQITTVTPNDKELLSNATDAPETISTAPTRLYRNSTKPISKWSMLSDSIQPLIPALSTNHMTSIRAKRTNATQISQLHHQDKINEIALRDASNAKMHQHLSNTTPKDNFKRHVIPAEYRLSIPLTNSQHNVTQEGSEIAYMKIQSHNTPLFDTKVDNSTVKSPASNHTEIDNKKLTVNQWNNHGNMTRLSTNVNSISVGMFNDSVDRVSLTTPENVLSIVHSDTHTLDDHIGEYENSTRISLNQWPVKHSAIVEGNLVLGGLMMVHEREDTVTCGPVMAQGGVQALEAMLYTLDWLNERDIVPGVKIGAHILDDCDKDTYGLEMAVDFIKGQ